MRALAAAGVALALTALVSGCSLFPRQTVGPLDQQPVAAKIATPPDQLRLMAINQTTVPVVLVVNGTPRDMPPESSMELGLVDLGPLPWDMAITTTAGRRLLGGTLGVGVVSRTNGGNGQGESTGFLARVDLSCGQLFLASNIASDGPAPRPGVPGDCD